MLNSDSGNNDKFSFVIRTIAVADAYNSKQPVLPHLHFSPLNGSTVVCPISPPDPCEPRQSLPSRITPPPTPVPSVTLITSRQPRAAPRHISPTAAAFASFSRNTGQPSRSCKAAFNPKLTREGRLGACSTTALSLSTAPGTMIDVATMRCTSSGHCSAAFASALTMQ